MAVCMNTPSPAPQATSVRVPLLRHQSRSVDVGLLIIRVSAGLFLAYHGAQKLFGLFGGPGISSTAHVFASIGYRPGTLFAVMCGMCEFGGGLGVALGALTPLAAAAMLGNMINATAVVFPHGFSDTSGGYEYPLLIGLIAAGLAFTGPGQYSVDSLIGLNRTALRPGLRTGAAAVALALVAASVTLLLKG